MRLFYTNRRTLNPLMVFQKPTKFIGCFSLLLLLTTCKKEITSSELSNSSIQYLNGGPNDKVQKIERTKDGGFIFCGYTITGVANYQAFLLKVDGNGKQEWYKTYGGAYLDLFNDAVQCSDGGYIAVGYTSILDGGGSEKDYVVKTDARGNMEWSKSFSDGTYSLCGLLDVTQGPDNYIYATGNYPSDSTWMATWVLKFDLSGTQVFSKKTEAAQSYKPNKFGIYDNGKMTRDTNTIGWAGGISIEVNTNGDILVGALLNNYEPYEIIPSLLSVKPGGNVNFYYPYLGNALGTSYNSQAERSEIIKVIPADNGYYLFWNYDSPGSLGAHSGIKLLKADMDGNPLWTKTYHGLGSALVFDVLKQSDGSFLVIGSSSPHPVNNLFPESFITSRAMVLKVDANGNTLSQEFWRNDNNTTFFKSIQPLPNGELMAAGYSCLNSRVYHSMFITKLSTNAKLKP